MKRRGNRFVRQQIDRSRQHPVVDQAVLLMRSGLNMRIAAEEANVSNYTLKNWIVAHCTQLLFQADCDLSTRHSTHHIPRREAAEDDE